MSALYSELSWLPRTPEDFYPRCKNALQDPESLGTRIRALASYGLNENHLIRLAKLIASARGQGKSLEPLSEYRLALISNGTVDFIAPTLTATAARYGIALECVTSGYDQAVQDSLNPDSAINRCKPHGVLIALDWRGVPLKLTLGKAEQAHATVNTVMGHIQMIRNGIQQNSGATCIVQNLAAPPELLMGSLDRVLPGAQRNLIDAVNQGLADSVLGTPDVLMDVAGLAETVGLANWFSPSEWNLAKLPFSQAYLPLYADHVCRIIAALRGKTRRCLVLDLDNTLWGGVIGDDGLKGIQIAQGDAAGEAFLALQRYCLALRERGIVLAVSSKNEDEIARRPSASIPTCCCAKDDISRSFRPTGTTRRPTSRRSPKS